MERTPSAPSFDISRRSVAAEEWPIHSQAMLPHYPIAEVHFYFVAHAEFQGVFLFADRCDQGFAEFQPSIEAAPEEGNARAPLGFVFKIFRRLRGYRSRQVDRAGARPPDMSSPPMHGSRLELGRILKTGPVQISILHRRSREV